MQLLLKNYVHLRNILKRRIKTKMMKTYSSLQKPVTFMYFWLNYCDKNHHIERIPVAVRDLYHPFNLASEIIKVDRPHLFLLFDDTQTDDT